MANVARLGGYGDTSGSGLMFRNKLINGGFDIWQRGTSQTSAGYGSDDRWNNGQNGSTKTASRQTFTLGQTDVPGNPKYWARTVVTSVAGASNFVYKQQLIENVNTFQGQTATLSFWAKADASKNMAVEFLQNFGSGGSPSSAVLGIGVTTIALTTSWKYFTITVNFPSISGKVLGTNNDDYIGFQFWFDAGSSFNARTNSLGQQSGTFDIANVQLEAGNQPTPFEQRPIGTELALCQRYFEKSYDQRDAPGTNTISLTPAKRGTLLYYTHTDGSGKSVATIYYKTTKRTANNTVTIYTADGTINTIYRSYSSAAGAVSVEITYNSDWGCCVGANEALTAWTVNTLLEFCWTCSAEL